MAVEIWVHTYFLGWNTGFTYFIFLLPVVFLLNASWRLWMIIFFNGTIVLITLAIWIQFYKVDPVYLISNEAVQYVSLLNGTGTGVIILIVMIFFSRSLNRRDQDLIEANYELEERNEEISKQHKSLQILIKEIHHRVKNNLQIISSLMSLQSRSVADREISEILNESRQRIDSIAMIHQKLSRDDQANRVDFKAYLEDLTLFQKNINSNLKCSINSPSVTLNLDVAVPLGIIISELIINANKHAFDKTDEPELFVLLEKIESGFCLVVGDNGIGYPIGFGRTKAESLGMEIINALVDQIGAKVEFSNHNGARCKIQFKDIEEPRRLRI
jgi:two-component sensor histidine kinase